LQNDAIWTFAHDILGVMSDSAGEMEAASSLLLGAVGTSYPGAFDARGLEGSVTNGIPDYYSFANNELDLGMRVTQPGDWIRVVTKVSEPSPLALMAFGLAGLGFVRRRKMAA